MGRRRFDVSLRHFHESKKRNPNPNTVGYPVRVRVTKTMFAKRRRRNGLSALAQLANFEPANGGPANAGRISRYEAPAEAATMSANDWRSAARRRARDPDLPRPSDRRREPNSEPAASLRRRPSSSQARRAGVRENATSRLEKAGAMSVRLVRRLVADDALGRLTRFSQHDEIFFIDMESASRTLGLADPVHHLPRFLAQVRSRSRPAAMADGRRIRLDGGAARQMGMR